MNVKILKDFDYSLDGMNPTSFKKGDKTEKFSVEQIANLVKSGLVGAKGLKADKPAAGTKAKVDTKAKSDKSDGFDDDDLGDGNDKK